MMPGSENQLDAALQTELEQCQSSLRETEERSLLGMHALELMHDIRDPLETLGHLTYLIGAEINCPERIREYLEQAEEQMQAMREMAREALQTSSPVARMVDLGEIAHMALRRHRRRSEAKTIHLKHDLQQGVKVPVCAGRMLRVISNLLANAIDALPEGGTVRLRLRKTATEVHLLVTDNGHGIEPEHREQIFRTFFTTKEGRGTGLGLAMSKRIVEEHKGRIRVRSCVVAGRCGTTFCVSLPVAA